MLHMILLKLRKVRKLSLFGRKDRKTGALRGVWYKFYCGEKYE